RIGRGPDADGPGADVAEVVLAGEVLLARLGQLHQREAVGGADVGGLPVEVGGGIAVHQGIVDLVGEDQGALGVRGGPQPGGVLAGNLGDPDGLAVGLNAVVERGPGRGAGPVDQVVPRVVVD